MEHRCPFCGSNDVDEREDHSGIDCNNCWQFTPMEVLEQWDSRNKEAK